MARIRTMKPEFCTSKSTAKLSLPARLFFAQLWTHVDDMGRCEYLPRLILGALYPYDDNIGNAELAGWIDECEAQGMVERYQVGDGRYLRVVNFKKHQVINRPTKSKYPPSPTEAEEDNETVNSDELQNDSVTTHGGLTEDSHTATGGLPEGSGYGSGSGIGKGIRNRNPEKEAEAESGKGKGVQRENPKLGRGRSAPPAAEGVSTFVDPPDPGRSPGAKAMLDAVIGEPPGRNGKPISLGGVPAGELSAEDQRRRQVLSEAKARRAAEKAGGAA